MSRQFREDRGLWLHPSTFSPHAVSAETAASNEALRDANRRSPAWWEVGVQETRAAAAEGRGPFPRPPKSTRAMTLHVRGDVPRRASGAPPVPLRVIAPEHPTGVYLFFHGGGMVFGGADVQDPTLERIVTSTGMACASVEYRLAPEHRYPAAWDDCESVAAWLIDHARSEFGTDVLTLGGESAGATLAVATLLRLRDERGAAHFRGVNLACGNFDASMTPSQRLSPEGGDPISAVGRTALEKYVEAFLPPEIDRRDPDVSPLYASVHDLPPALFTVCTLDPLLDDSLFLCARWIAAGNEAELAVYPGAPHGFTSLPTPQGPAAAARIDAFLRSVLSESRASNAA